MDAFLFDQWRAASPPFDGLVLSHGDDLPVAVLRNAVRVTVTGLKQHYGELDLVAVNDWHEHDGVVLPGRATTWRALEGALKSDAALFAASDGDDYVYRAFYPSSGDFLLRFDILESDSTMLNSRSRGRFDLSAPAPVLQAIVGQLDDGLREEISMENAKQYFDGRYAGWE